MDRNMKKNMKKWMALLAALLLMAAAALGTCEQVEETDFMEIRQRHAQLREQEALGNLVMGCTGEDVRQLQEDLQALEYYTGDVTGHFGTKTEEAVLAYQKAAGLTEDGFVTPELLEAIHDQAAEKTKAP